MNTITDLVSIRNKDNAIFIV